MQNMNMNSINQNVFFIHYNDQPFNNNINVNFTPKTINQNNFNYLDNNIINNTSYNLNHQPKEKTIIETVEILSSSSSENGKNSNSKN